MIMASGKSMFFALFIVVGGGGGGEILPSSGKCTFSCDSRAMLCVAQTIFSCPLFLK